MTLQRVDTTYRGKPTHYYELDGQRVDGATTLIGAGLPKPALTYWSAGEVAAYTVNNLDQIRDMLDTGGAEPTLKFLKQVPWQKRDTAAVRGTDVHALAERVVKGEPVEVPEDLHGYVDGYARWLDRSQVVPVLTEFVVASRPWRYAGTADLIVKDHMGVSRIADLKTGKRVYADTALQLAAYRFAEFYLDGDGAECPVPEVDDTGWVIHVTAEGTDAYPVPVDERQWKTFLHVATVARWQKTSKELVGSAVRFPTMPEATA